ncbi:GNAT family N-acetyltransferase [Hymenobacter sp. IS2118]|uniref:GNAT family N-acetyltransferase n=1 Tax=Hymenobacter sp. IS2118 TaxID=1505605 RepID=UPI00068C1C40|nr:GNAT family N-acetyltransferase [Hymenobacter sp. IS2118]
MLPRAPLYTERLCLRPYEPADADDFFALLHANRARLQSSFPDRLLAVREPTDAVASLRAFVEDWRTGRFYVFGIWHRATAEYVGDICLMPQLKGQAEIGYYLAAAAEGQGFAREALLATIAFGFESVGSQRLLVRCYAHNGRGQAVARAAGFQLEPPSKRMHWFRNSDALADICRFWLVRDVA